MTIGESLAAFERDWVSNRPITPRIAYGRTLRLLRYWLGEHQVRLHASLDGLTAAQLEAFVAWHASSGLADDADGSRKVALHVARLGQHLAAAAARPDLALDRHRLRAIAGR